MKFKRCIIDSKDGLISELERLSSTIFEEETDGVKCRLNLIEIKDHENNDHIFVLLFPIYATDEVKFFYSVTEVKIFYLIDAANIKSTYKSGVLSQLNE